MSDNKNMIGIEKIRAERDKQISLGYDVRHDAARYTPDVLLRAGACYADLAALQVEMGDRDAAEQTWGGKHPFWPEDSGLPWHPELDPTENAAKGAAYLSAGISLFTFFGTETLMGEDTKDE